MKYTERSQRPETQDTRRELMELYNRGDMPEHPDMLIRTNPIKQLTHDADVWRK